MPCPGTASLSPIAWASNWTANAKGQCWESEHENDTETQVPLR